MLRQFALRRSRTQKGRKLEMEHLLSIGGGRARNALPPRRGLSPDPGAVRPPWFAGADRGQANKGVEIYTFGLNPGNTQHCGREGFCILCQPAVGSRMSRQPNRQGAILYAAISRHSSPQQTEALSKCHFLFVSVFDVLLLPFTAGSSTSPQSTIRD